MRSKPCDEDVAGLNKDCEEGAVAGDVDGSSCEGSLKDYNPAGGSRGSAD